MTLSVTRAAVSVRTAVYPIAVKGGMLGRERRSVITVINRSDDEYRREQSVQCSAFTAAEIPGVQTGSGCVQQRGAVEPLT